MYKNVDYLYHCNNSWIQDGKIHSSGPTFVIENSWLYQFKHKHLKPCMHLARGLEISKTQGLTSHFCNSFY